MIDGYTFGRMVIDGKAYTSDLLILPDGTVADGWRRRQGHGLCLDDLQRLLDAGPRIVISGTGAYGVMRPAPDLAEALSRTGIDYTALPTREAICLYNQLCAGDKAVGACFHLTC